MPTNTGVKMDYKEIISKYLEEKSNETEVIALLREHKKLLASPKNKFTILNKEYFSLILKLAKNSKGKIKYHALIILSHIDFFLEAKNFYELCRIAAENSKDDDGNIRQANFIIIKNLNAWMITLPLINKLQNASQAEVDMFYESFKYLFLKLQHLFYDEGYWSVRKSILQSLEVMLPKFYDVAKFWKDEEEVGIANKLKEEINKELHHGTRN